MTFYKMFFFKKKEKTFHNPSFKQRFYVDLLDVGDIKNMNSNGWTLLKVYEANPRLIHLNSLEIITPRSYDKQNFKLLVGIFTDEKK